MDSDEVGRTLVIAGFGCLDELGPRSFDRRRNVEMRVDDVTDAGPAGFLVAIQRSDVVDIQGALRGLEPEAFAFRPGEDEQRPGKDSPRALPFRQSRC